MNGRSSVRATGESLNGILESFCRCEWRIDQAPNSAWLHVHKKPAPRQGWKLHVSATCMSAREVLQGVLPLLCVEDAGFKVAASLSVLESLNHGVFGLSQIGKFITVYPNDEAQAVRLAVVLDLATRGLAGPAVPSDRTLATGGLVHYRYGGFDSQTMRTPLGEVVSAMSTPEGVLVPDLRRSAYRAPDWVVDPFEAAAVAVREPPVVRCVAGRFLIVSILAVAPRGATYLCVDLECARACVLKEARRDAAVARDGLGAQGALRREFELLGLLASEEGVPRAYDLVEDSGDLFLAMECIAGETLEDKVAGLTRRGRRVGAPELIEWGRGLARILGALHRRGWVHRDLKPANIILTKDHRLRLVDLGIASRIGGPRAARGCGTPGFWSPQQRDGAAASVADDIYGLGALLYFAATGSPLLLDEASVLDRPPSQLNPAIHPDLEAVITRCLNQDSIRRHPTMWAVDNALEGIRTATGSSPTVSREPADHERWPETRLVHIRELADRLGDTLCRDVQALVGPAVDSEGGTVRVTDLSGDAGAVLGLAEVVSELGGADRASVLAAGARALITTTGSGPDLPGLHVGEAGVGVALLRAGQVLRDHELIAAAVERGRRVASMPYASPDVFNGTAGRILFHLLVWQETQDRASLRSALTAGESLLNAMDRPRHGEACWRIPKGYSDLSGAAFLGYAHGAAGIGDVLLDLFQITGDQRFLGAVRDTARWLGRQALRVLEDGSGLGWPAEEGQEVFHPVWCHGATGIGRFFKRGASFDVMPEARELAVKAAQAAACGITWGGHSQCHGLAGNIELLLDMYQSTGETIYLLQAKRLAGLLDTFAVEDDGMVTWPSESPRERRSYLLGNPGVAVCLLRLCDPDQRPQQLSLRGFESA